MKKIENTADIIDSREIIERIAELTEWYEQDEPDSDDAKRAELAALTALAAEAQASPDWEYGESLIRETYFEQYAEDVAEDIGAIPSEYRDKWPMTCIDWASAARELQADYLPVDFDGVLYWIRQ